MRNRNWYLIILIIISIYLINRNRKSTISNDNKFEVADNSLITKIFLADRNGNTITLDKHNDNWLVNNKFNVRRDAISTLLSTIKKIKIRKPVSNKAFENVIKYMATSGVSVEIFSDKKMIKSYTIGSNTPDHIGTYMLLKNSQKPYVIHIPAFNGFLSPRYGIQASIIDVNSWRSNSIFKLSANEINQLQYTDFNNIKNSYSLKTSPLTLIDSQGKNVSFNKQKILRLLNSFENLNCEAFKENKYKIDSTNQLDELIVNFDTLRTYQISKLTTNSEKEDFTVRRRFATINNGELMLIQDYVFNKVLINIDEIKE